MATEPDIYYDVVEHPERDWAGGICEFCHVALQHLEECRLLVPPLSMVSRLNAEGYHERAYFKDMRNAICFAEGVKVRLSKFLRVKNICEGGALKMSDAKPASPPSCGSSSSEPIAAPCSEPNDTGSIVVINEEGHPIQNTKSYGLGLDVHSKFIQVSVIVKVDSELVEYNKAFNTDWQSLTRAKEWAQSVVETKSSPLVDLKNTPFHYTLESTATYYYPVIQCWAGVPSVVNPSLAGQYKRKTDVLDSRLLATFDLTGLWRPFYIVPRQIMEVRVLLNERAYHSKIANSIGNHTNSILLQFGYTVGRSGSVVNDAEIRSLVENLLSDHPSISNDCLPPEGIPESIKPVLRNLYKRYDAETELCQQLLSEAVAKLNELDFKTDCGNKTGREMIDLLTSCPGVGVLTAVYWLVYIVDPDRFPNAKAISAYCGLDPSLKISAGHVTSTKMRGGNKQLHGLLCRCGSTLMKNHNEYFGRWGYNIYLQTGHWKKGTNALGRKLCVALYYMNKKGEKFTYDKYSMIKEVKVLDVSIDELVQLNSDFKRYAHILKDAGINSTPDLVRAYYACSLHECKGLGKKFYALVRDFIDNQKGYRELFDKRSLNHA